MSDAVWKRHANPWSVWTRVPLIVFFAVAIWSRAWIGGWALLPLVLLILWTWLNPRIFPPPASTDNWASKATFGERVWIARKTLPIPEHHAFAANLLSALAALGVLPFVWGLYTYEIWPVFLGICLILLGKLWFLDRMVWLYEDMRDQSPNYRSWLY